MDIFDKKIFKYIFFSLQVNGSIGMTSSETGRPIEKRKYVDDDDDDIQVIDSSGDDSTGSNGIVVSNPGYSRSLIQIEPVEIRPSSFSSSTQSFHPSLQFGLSQPAGIPSSQTTRAQLATPREHFSKFVTCETPAMAALAKVSCFARSQSSPLLSVQPRAEHGTGDLGAPSDRKPVSSDGGPNQNLGVLGTTPNGPKCSSGDPNRISLHTDVQTTVTGKLATLANHIQICRVLFIKLTTFISFCNIEVFICSCCVCCRSSLITEGH